MYNICGGGLVAKSYLTLATLWTVACQASLSMGFSKHECWSELSFPSLRDFPDAGIKATFPALPGSFFTAEPQGKILVSN